MANGLDVKAIRGLLERLKKAEDESMHVFDNEGDPRVDALCDQIAIFMSGDEGAALLDAAEERDGLKEKLDITRGAYEELRTVALRRGDERDAAVARAEKAEARVATLQTALEPFVRASAHMPDSWPHGDPGVSIGVPVSAIAAARAALGGDRE